jgi:predicted DNA-binding mobile mystery protein A
MWAEAPEPEYLVSVVRAARCRQLDDRLIGLDASIGPRPLEGWIKAIRQTLGMTVAALAARMGVSPPRLSQIERSEVSGGIQMRTLERAAAALNCRLFYVLVPAEPLEDMVQRQARARAGSFMAMRGDLALGTDEAVEPYPDDLVSRAMDAVAHQLVDRRDLWKGDASPPEGS